MAVDINRVLSAAVQAALEVPTPPKPKKKKRHFRAGPAFLLGAGLMTAGRVVVRTRGREMLDSIQQRLAELEAQHLGSDEQELVDEEEWDGEAEEDEDWEDEELDEEQPRVRSGSGRGRGH